MYLERSGSFMAAIVLALGLVVATVIGGFFFVKGKRGDQTITVTGSARKRIKSDLVIWRWQFLIRRRCCLKPTARFRSQCRK